jgi:penicillin-binding protein 1A
MSDQYQSREERRKQRTTQGSQKVKKKPAGMVRKIFLTIIALGIIGMLAGVATFAYLVKDAPKLDPKLLKDPIASKILDKNGKLITEVGAANRDYVAYKDIPKVVEDAFLATEDYRFYQHHGIDPIRLGGAVLANIQHGFGAEGGSTITQQVVKNSFLSQQKTVTRKVQEAWLAYQLEQKYTKHQILEMYLNKIYFSENANGVATAAEAYYGKNIKNVTLPEAAMLAGLPQSPNNYNPFNHPDLAKKRRDIVLSLMHQHGFISKAEMENAEKVPVQAALVKNDQRKLNEKPYDSFVDEVIDEVKKAGDFDIFSDGLTIYTTLDSKAQLYVDKILNTNKIVNYPNDQFQAGITLLDTKTGEIRAIGGGRNQKVQRGFNYAIDSQRQPGSTIKPILDYGPAIEYLQWGTYQMIEDKPVTYSTGKTFGNWDNRYMGPMTIRTALQLSRNTPAVQTLQQVGTDKAKQFAVNLGIPLKEVYESYAIGGFTHGVSTLQMAGAYSAFGNNGFYTKPHAITKIQLRDGTEINTVPEPKVVMKDYTAFMITDMLKSVLKYPGTGVRANVPGLPLAGKSGTTNYTDGELRQWNIGTSKAVPDAWFTGYTTNYTASVWTGYKDRSTPIEPGDNQKIAQDIFRNLMEYVSKDVNTPDFTVPTSVQRVKIEKGSMPPKLASEYTPDSQVLIEYAVKGHAPKNVSDKFNKLDAPTGVSANYDQVKNEIALSWNYSNTSIKDVQFDVSVSVNNGAEQKLTSTMEKGLRIAHPTPGANYVFRIIANVTGNSSDPATVSITIPGTTQTNPQDGQNGNQNGGNQGNNGGDQGNNGGTTPPGTNPGNGNNGGNNNNNGGTTGNGAGGSGNGTGSPGTGSTGTGG